jgi:hypothetical protein
MAFANPTLTGDVEDYSSISPSAVLKTDQLDDLYLCPLKEKTSESFSRRAVGDRRHFRYSNPFPFSPSDSDEEDLDGEEAKSDQEFARSCIKALSNCCARRLNRAMIDLVGIEPHPGPRSKARRQVTVTTVSQRKLQPVAKRLRRKSGRSMTGDMSAMSLSTGMRPSRPTDAHRYMCVLADPFSCEPVRLGGEMMQPSAIASLTYKGILLAGSNSTLSLVFYPRAVDPLLSSTNTGPPYTYVTQGVQFVSGASLGNIALGGRVISAGIRVQTVNSSQADNGIVTAGCIPRDVITIAGPAGVTLSGLPYDSTTGALQGFAQFNNYSQTEIFPLKSGCSVVYRPTDPLDFTFRDTLTGNPALYVIDEAMPPCMVVGISGCSGSSAILVELIAHIEYTVNEGSTGVVDQEMGTLTTPELAKIANATFQQATNTATSGGTSSWFDSMKHFGKSALPYVGELVSGAFRTYLGRKPNYSIPSMPFSGKSYGIDGWGSSA